MRSNLRQNLMIYNILSGINDEIKAPTFTSKSEAFPEFPVKSVGPHLSVSICNQ